MIARVNHYVLGAVVAAASLMAVLAAKPSVPAQPPLAGVLTAQPGNPAKRTFNQRPAPGAGSESAEHKAPPPVLLVSLDPGVRTALPSSEEILVRFVPPASSSFTLSLIRKEPAQRSPRRSPAPFVHTTLAVSSQPAKLFAPDAAPAVPTVEAAAAMAVTKPTPAVPPPPTFSQLDEALRESPSTQTVNQRTRDGLIMFKITHIGRLDGRNTIRYAIVNEEMTDFFLSIVNVAADGRAITASTLGSFVCRSHEEVFGIVQFPAAAAAGRRVELELVQSGGDRRRLRLPVEYAF